MMKNMNLTNITTLGEKMKMKKMTKLFKNQKGLTLVELLAVIVILAIVAAIAVPSIGNIINNSRDKAILANASTVLSGAKLAATDGSCGDGKSGDYSCNKATLDQYVEGVSVATGDLVVKTEGTWKITYGDLANIKNKTKFGVNKTTLTEAELNAAMTK